MNYSWMNDFLFLGINTLYTLCFFSVCKVILNKIMTTTTRPTGMGLTTNLHFNRVANSIFEYANSMNEYNIQYPEEQHRRNVHHTMKSTRTNSVNTSSIGQSLTSLPTASSTHTARLTTKFRTSSLTNTRRTFPNTSR